MNFRKGIHIVIVLVVVSTTLVFLWLLSLPILGRLGIPSIKPYWLTTAVWNIITTILAMIAIIGNVIFIIFWLIWKVLKTLDFFPLDIFVDIILDLTPFPELDQSGFFRLYDRIFSIGGSMENQFKQYGKALTQFLIDNKGVYAEVTKPFADAVSISDQPQKSSDNSADKDPNPQKQSLLNDTEKRTVDELYQQCLEEQLQDIKNNISQSDKLKLQTANAAAKMKCKAKSVFNIQNLITYKMPS